VDASTAPSVPFRWVLPLTAAGSALQRQEWLPATRHDEVTLVEIDARAGFGQPARITGTTILRGVPGLQQQIQFSGLTQEQLLTGIRQQAVGNFWQTVDTVQWHYDMRAGASILVISGTGTLDWSD